MSDLVPTTPSQVVKAFRVVVESLDRRRFPALYTTYVPAETKSGRKLYGPYYVARWKATKYESGRTIYLGKRESESVEYFLRLERLLGLPALSMGDVRMYGVISSAFAAKVEEEMGDEIRELAREIGNARDVEEEHLDRMVEILEEVLSLARNFDPESVSDEYYKMLGDVPRSWLTERWMPNESAAVNVRVLKQKD